MTVYPYSTASATSKSPIESMVSLARLLAGTLAAASNWPDNPVSTTEDRDMLSYFKISAHYGKAAILTVYVASVSNDSTSVALAAESTFPQASLIVTEPVPNIPESIRAFVPMLTTMHSPAIRKAA